MRRSLAAGSLVLVLAVLSLSAQSTPPATGAALAWEKLLKLRTIVSVMHVTAHPDDEQGGVLVKLGRGEGARVTMLTLNRGESGDNAIGPQLFDALGLIRTEELMVANRYYGVDQQYFTTLVDYGYSKTLEESMARWGRDTVLRDMVRIIRMERPTILLSRFQGTTRDGHGNHQAAGAMATLAVEYAGDSTMFPDQIASGLRPWRPVKAYVGGVRENEDWTVRIDTGEYNPILGDAYENIARMGLSFQRSQVAGRFTPVAGPNLVYYRRADLNTSTSPREQSVFDGLSTTMESVAGAAGRAIDEAVAKAVAAFTMTDPTTSVPMLADGLRLTREAIVTSVDPQVRHLLGFKEQQFQDAINAAMGARLTAATDPPLMPAPVPGQTFAVTTRLELRGPQKVGVAEVRLVGDAGWATERAEATRAAEGAENTRAAEGAGATRATEGAENTRATEGAEVTRAAEGRFRVRLADNVAISTKPYFFRTGLQSSRYFLLDGAQFGRPVTPAPLVAVAEYSVNGVPVTLREPVRRRDAKAPYGEAARVVRTVPRIAVSSSPAFVVVPAGQGEPVSVDVTVLHNANEPSNGQVTLNLPEGWSAKPASQAFAFARAGERATFRFAVTPGRLEAGPYEIEAVAMDARPPYEYREGYELIDHRDLELRYLYREATTTVRGVNVSTVAGLKVGYVMGIGDQVPQALQQLGAEVTLLGERDLAGADLSAYDTIVTGTRAYAVRDDLKTYNARLLDYVRAGGNLIVLYNTQEFVPNTFAPFPGELPRTAEEVSEEDSPVTILAPTHQAFTWPNRITTEDFDGWVEQRGSKFFTTWAPAYTPMISTFDTGQKPQSGGWLTARVGKGTWTYFAYALHRQLPYGVPGAYRITANLLALGRQPGR